MQEMTFMMRPDGPAAEIWQALGGAGITMEASCTYPTLDGRVVRIVVADGDAEAARQALLDAGFGALDRREVLISDVENRPGKLGELAQRLADAGVTLTTLYMAMGDRVVVGAEDLAKVRAVLG